MKEKFSLKDALFNQERVTYFAALLHGADHRFDSWAFVTEVVGRFPELELKARIKWMAEVLVRYLPGDPAEALSVIGRALPPELDSSQMDNDFGEFILAPLGEYVVQVGCTAEYVQLALGTLYQITKRFSMEDAMRTFLNNFPNETLAAYDKWVNDKNYHVRRLVSESLRPSLPWSQKINIDYKIPLKYLDVLHADTTRYVIRSVANHLNDMSKKDSALVIVILKRWRDAKLQTESELAWMTRHALRTLVKKGDSAALYLLGFGQCHGVTVSHLQFSCVNNVIFRGDKFKFVFVITAEADSNLLVDYCIDFVKANGATKPKVFKLKKLTLKGGETVTITKSHYLKADATTFTLNPGLHTLTIHVNGQKLASAPFQVI